MIKPPRVQLGDEVRDIVTGFQGIATAMIQYLVGCRHVGITSTELKDDGEPRPVQWIDEPQVEVVKRNAVEIPIGYEPEAPQSQRPAPRKRKPGGPSVAPPRRATP